MESSNGQTVENIKEIGVKENNTAEGSILVLMVKKGKASGQMAKESNGLKAKLLMIKSSRNMRKIETFSKILVYC